MKTFPVALLVIAFPVVCIAQVPRGTITGRVRDASGAVVADAEVELLNPATRERRTTVSAGAGLYTFTALMPADYEVSVKAAGFQRMVRTATVEAGTTTAADFTLAVGAVGESVTVSAVSPRLHYDSATVSGVTTRTQVEALPLNGRNFLELAKLEPGVQPPTAANRNRSVVPVLGAPAANVGGARYTIDGGSVTAVGLGGSQVNLSQEVVQEFQVATVTPGLSAGMTDAGIINVITRSGSNRAEGTGFYFLRNHTLSAYPALARDPANPDPFFRRQQFGAAVGGPVRQNRVFYFGNWERNDQQSVASTKLVATDFTEFSRITSTPLRGDLLSIRGDVRISSRHSAFIRYSRDDSRGFGPGASISGGSPNAYPSNWNRVKTHSAQTVVGITSILGTALVNDARGSYFGVDTALGPGTQDECAGCIGLGMPALNVTQAGAIFGNSSASNNRERRVHIADSVTWQRSTHRLRAGLDWEYNRDLNLIWNNEPVTMTLFSPDQVRTYNARNDTPANLRIPLPLAFQTYDDLLSLPLQSLTLSVGDPGIPQEHGGSTRTWNTVWIYLEDTWRPHDRVTLNYGLGWGVDTNLNHDLQKPPLLAPLLGDDGLKPTRINHTNFSPVLGMVWTPSSDHRTIVRAGGGRFYRPHGLTGPMDAERVALGSSGIGRQTLGGAFFRNPLPDIAGVAVGRTLDFRGSPTLFTAADLLAILPSLRASAVQQLTGAAGTGQAIQVTKQMQQPGAIFPAAVATPSATHANVGIQRQVGRGLVVSADAVYRHFADVPANGGAIDVNHFNSARGPVIPACSTAAAADPLALCSLGPINVYKAPYRFTYKGLLIRADERLSSRVQLLGSYAWSSNSGTNTGTGFNLDDWLQNSGPAPGDVRHLVNVAAVLRAPYRFAIAANFSYAGRSPFSAFVGGADFNGDGTSGDLLPGTTVNAFNRGMDRRDLERLVTAFNATSTGTKDAQGRAIPHLTLPQTYSFDRDFQTLDVRVTRPLRLSHRWHVALIAEVFNLYNRANLSGYSGDLTSAAFGQPTSRMTQVFGSGGPRSFQLALKAAF